MKYRTIYMHTLGGQAAFYEKNRQVCYISGNGRVIHFPQTLKALRAEWKASEKWRSSQGYGESRVKHGYLRIRLPLNGRVNQP